MLLNNVSQRFCFVSIILLNSYYISYKIRSWIYFQFQNKVVTYLNRHPLALWDFRWAHLDVFRQRFQTKDELEIGAAEVGFVHVSKRNNSKDKFSWDRIDWPNIKFPKIDFWTLSFVGESSAGLGYGEE